MHEVVLCRAGVEGDCDFCEEVVSTSPGADCMNKNIRGMLASVSPSSSSSSRSSGVEPREQSMLANRVARKSPR